MKLNKINLIAVIFVICLVGTHFLNSAGLRNKKKNKSETKNIQEKLEPDTNGFMESSITSGGSSTLLQRNRDEKKEERRKLAMNKDDDVSEEDEEEEEDEKNKEITTTVNPNNEVQKAINKNSKTSPITHKLHREKELEESNEEFARKVHLNGGRKNKRSDEIHSLGRAKELDENNEIVNAKPKNENKNKRSINIEYLKNEKRF
ncbi:Hypothetical protein SRAE_X000151200 [Strongyloides ratti]|uniref:Uncharacterized protein n=1 Tax=Strongyloides ratti TaxID=34506 RepID=A0A090KX21_STRRB|nr:Hypothetical protein SRAE_X000151200 [Strongyloides ratti]CEF59767.1 Hypothetical protein SRAE_X000151200 [Strongyloides ratti]